MLHMGRCRSHHHATAPLQPPAAGALQAPVPARAQAGPWWWRQWWLVVVLLLLHHLAAPEGQGGGGASWWPSKGGPRHCCGRCCHHLRCSHSPRHRPRQLCRHHCCTPVLRQSLDVVAHAVAARQVVLLPPQRTSCAGPAPSAVAATAPGASVAMDTVPIVARGQPMLLGLLQQLRPLRRRCYHRHHSRWWCRSDRQ